MKRWIRLKGLIAFIAVVAAIVLLWVLVVDTVVRRVIEQTGTRVVGARVDLADADLTLFPTGLTLTGLAVTNPDKPMKNAVEIQTMKMDLDPAYLIKRKVIVNNMIVAGLSFNTDRRTSGAIPRPQKPKEEENGRETSENSCGKFSMPDLSRTDVATILAKEQLASVEQAKTLQAEIKADEKRWEKRLTELADKKKLADYQKRVEKLKGTGGSLGAILGAAGDVQQLQADIQRDLNHLKQAQTDFKKDLNRYQGKVQKLSKAPLGDINRLMEKYSISPKGMDNLSQLIFGQPLCGWMKTLWETYETIKPYLPETSPKTDDAPEVKKPLRGKGIDIKFPEVPPMPDFLIRNLKINALVAAGDLTGKAENITFAQHILGSPTTFAFLGKEMKNIEALSLIGSADYVKPDRPKNSVRLSLQGLAVKDIVLVDQAAFPLTLSRATSQLKANMATEKDAIHGTITADFGNVTFNTASDKPKSQIAEAMGDALSRVKQFSVHATIDGTFDEYSINADSNLDKVLQSALGSLVKKEAAKFQAALTRQINAKFQDPLTQAKQSVAGLEDIEAELARRLDLGDDLRKGLKLPF